MRRTDSQVFPPTASANCGVKAPSFSANEASCIVKSFGIQVACKTVGKRLGPLRFVPKGLKANRVRLGLSAADYAKLLGVSGQTVYNWELGATRPRAEQLAALASLRGIGKREARARLQKLNGSINGSAGRRTPA